MQEIVTAIISDENCHLALANAENLIELVEAIKPFAPSITSDGVRKLFDIPEEISDERSMPYIRLLISKVSSMLQEDDQFLSSISGGVPPIPGGMYDQSSAMSSMFNTQLAIGLGTAALGGSMTLAATIGGNKQMMKLSSQNHAQNIELENLQTENYIKKLKASVGNS